MIVKLYSVLLIVFSLASDAHAQERIRIAWAGASPANAAIWVLQEKKLLQKYGVEPEIISISASPIVLQALLAGEIDVSAISVTTLVSSRLAGADTVMILGIVRTFVDHIISQQNITAADQLKGKIGGVNRIGSTSDMGLRFALRRLNIDPEKDTQNHHRRGQSRTLRRANQGRDQFHHHAGALRAPGLAAGLPPLVRYRLAEDSVSGGTAF